MFVARATKNDMVVVETNWPEVPLAETERFSLDVGFHPSGLARVDDNLWTAGWKRVSEWEEIVMLSAFGATVERLPDMWNPFCGCTEPHGQASAPVIATTADSVAAAGMPDAEEIMPSDDLIPDRSDDQPTITVADTTLLYSVMGLAQRFQEILDNDPDVTVCFKYNFDFRVSLDESKVQLVATFERID